MRLLPGDKGNSSDEDDEAPETESGDFDTQRPVRVDAAYSHGPNRPRRNPMRSIRIGDWIDVREEDGFWYPAEVKKLNNVAKQIFVSFCPDPMFDKWVAANSSSIAPLYTNTYDERGNFRPGQMVEAMDDRGVFRLAKILEFVPENDVVVVEFHNESPNDNRLIHSPMKRIRTFRKGTSNQYRRWKIPGASNASSSSMSSSSSSSAAAAYADGHEKENKPVDNRIRQISALSERFRNYIEALDQQGRHVVQVSGDGNCLFRAVAHQVYGDDELFWLVRDRGVAYMEADAQFFSQFVEGGMASFPYYLEAKRQNGCWGDDPEIQVRMNTYVVGILVHYELIF
jgi:hypothetical protein